MGWYGIYRGYCARNRRGGINRKRTIDNEMNTGTTRVVMSTMRGTVWYGVIKEVATDAYVGLVCPTHIADGELMYKPLSEDMGPIYYAMPASYLGFLDARAPLDTTTQAGKWAAEWRESCRRYQGERAAERREARAWKARIRELRAQAYRRQGDER